MTQHSPLRQALRAGLFLDWLCSLAERAKAFLRLPASPSLVLTPHRLWPHVLRSFFSKSFTLFLCGSCSPETKFDIFLFPIEPSSLFPCLPDAADHHVRAGNRGQGHGGKRSGPDGNGDGHHHHRRQERPRARVHAPAGEGENCDLKFWICGRQLRSFKTRVCFPCREAAIQI